MNNNDYLCLDLMKNPYKYKKKKIDYNNYIDKLHIELIKKFKDYNIDNNLYEIILKKIEIILLNSTIKEIVNNIIDEIVNEFKN